MPKRTSYLKGDKLYKYLNNLRAEIKHLYREAREKGLSLDEIIQRRGRLMSDDSVAVGRNNWSRLTGLDQARIFGYCDGLSDALHAELVFLYLINDKWYTGDEVVKGKDGVNQRDATRDNGYFCYKMKDGTFKVWSPSPK